jgi:hypothetical protein
MYIHSLLFVAKSFQTSSNTNTEAHIEGQLEKSSLSVVAKWLYYWKSVE